MQVFFAPNVTLGIYKFSEEESKHIVRVLRYHEGEQIHLINGNGGLFEGHISLAEAKHCEALITSEKHSTPRPFRVHIAVSPTKMMDRMEWFVEKATEIGIDEITPILTEHSERKELKIERLDKIAIAAIKQSKNLWMPKINQAVKLSSFLKEINEEQRFIAHCMENEKQYLNKVCLPNKNTIVLIGPEGDFSPTEVAACTNEGFKPVSLGINILRTETAALAACHTINLNNL